jgi:hypothetical protein
MLTAGKMVFDKRAAACVVTNFVTSCFYRVGVALPMVVSGMELFLYSSDSQPGVLARISQMTSFALACDLRQTL